MKFYTYLAAILLFSSCSHPKIPNLHDTELKKISDISAKDSQLIDNINYYTFTGENMYLFDITSQKLVVFNYNGKYLGSIGKKGEGPGEFLDVTGVFAQYDGISFIDQRKNKYIKYNNKYEFIKENVIKISSVEQPITYGNNIIAWYNKVDSNNNTYILNRGVGLFSDSLNLIKDIYSLEKIYKPYLLDPNRVSSVFSVNSNNGDVAISKIDSKEFNINIYDGNLNYKKNITLNLQNVYYTKEEYDQITEYYKDWQKNYRNKYNHTIKLEKLDNRRRIVLSLSYDGISNLWVLVPGKNNSKKIYIFNQKYESIGFIPVKNEFGKIFIFNDILYNVYGTSQEDTTVEVYKIIHIKSS